MNKLIKILRGKRKDKKGFTLMEMLIVVAIIAILVAIAVPTFNSSLDKAKQAADDANIRTAYTEYILSQQKDENGNSEVNAPTVADNKITFSDGTVYTLKYYSKVKTKEGASGSEKDVKWVGEK